MIRFNRWITSLAIHIRRQSMLGVVWVCAFCFSGGWCELMLEWVVIGSANLLVYWLTGTLTDHGLLVGYGLDQKWMRDHVVSFPWRRSLVACWLLNKHGKNFFHRGLTDHGQLVGYGLDWKWTRDSMVSFPWWRSLVAHWLLNKHGKKFFIGAWLIMDNWLVIDWTENEWGTAWPVFLGEGHS